MRRVALAAVLVIAAGCYDTRKPLPPGIITGNAGLDGGVEIFYDGLGIPHIYAASDADLAYAHGYVQARDRLFQMDFMRRAGRGRLAELIGPPGLSTDVQTRTIFTARAPASTGSWRIEDVIAEQLAPGRRAFIQRYADGVNRYLADLKKGINGARLPAEYEVLGVTAAEIAPWTIQDSLALQRLLTWQLSGTLEEELSYGALYSAFPMTPLAQGTFADLTRFAPASQSFILPGALALPTAAGAALAPLPPGLGGLLARAAGDMEGLSRIFGPEKAGSNNWVVGPGHSTTGNALVANDPHLQLSNPAIWHVAHLVSPTRNVAGVAFTGAPVILIGTNGKIAWGDTVVGYDVTDVYIEQVIAASGSVVRPTGPVPITVVNETVNVRGAGPTPLAIQISPGHGPIIEMGTTPIAPGVFMGLSFRWTGQEPSQEFAAFLDVDTASNVDEALTAMKQFQVGAQNFVVADDQGNIGYYPHAYVPIRGSNGSCLSPPWAPMPGWDGSCEWTGRIPDPPSCSGTSTTGYLPCLKNPPQGWVATANNDVTGYTKANAPLDPLHHPYFYATTDLGFRHQRIVERLGAGPAHSLDDMTSIQADSTSDFAAAVVPAVLSLLGTRTADVTANNLGAAVSLLAHWGDAAASSTDPGPYTTPTGLSGVDPLSPPSSDAAVAARSEAAALFHAFVPRFARRILDPNLGAYTVTLLDGSTAPLSVDVLLGLEGDQPLAKYLVALSGHVLGTPPAVPLNTATGLCVAPAAGAVCSDEALMALEDAVKFLAEASVFGTADPGAWRWGRTHRVVLDSLLGIPFLSVGPYARQGGLYTVDVADFGWDDDGSRTFDDRHGFMVRHGPSVRFSAELAPGKVRWRAVIPGGESGFPGDPHFSDQVPAWLANAKGDQPYARADVVAAAATKIELWP